MVSLSQLLLQQKHVMDIIKYVFSLVGDNAASGGYFAGCNLGWGGFANLSMSSGR